MHTLGHDFIADPIHAGGLRYHGMAPIICNICEHGLMEAVAIPQTSASRRPCSSCAPRASSRRRRPTHAIAAAVREALACKETGEEKVILTSLCGHGHFDLAAYDAYLNGRMVDA